MPITQDRMLALINAAENYRLGLEEACNLVQAAMELARSDPSTAMEHLKILSMSVSLDALMVDKSRSIETLVSERQHFRANRAKNVKRAIKAEKRRREAGILPSGTAPRNLSHPGTEAPAPVVQAAKLKENAALAEYDRIQEEIARDRLLELQGPIATSEPLAPPPDLLEDDPEADDLIIDSGGGED